MYRLNLFCQCQCFEQAGSEASGQPCRWQGVLCWSRWVGKTGVLLGAGHRRASSVASKTTECHMELHGGALALAPSEQKSDQVSPGPQILFCLPPLPSPESHFDRPESSLSSASIKYSSIEDSQQHSPGHVLFGAPAKKFP